MELSFEQLKSMVVFAQVIEQGNFSAAAKHLGLSRAVVSYHVKKLETQLGVRLLNRSTRALALTEEGRLYYQRCRAIALEASAAQRQIENLKQEPEGLLKITCPVNVGLQLVVPALDEFKKIYQKIQLDVLLTDEVTNIVREGIDFAIRGAPLVDSDLQATHLATLNTYLCASSEYLDQYGWPSAVEDLALHQWVLYKPAPKLLEFSREGRSYSIAVKGDVATNNAAARTAFVEGGHGLGRIPVYDAKPKIETGRLKRLMPDFDFAPIDVYGVFSLGAANSKKLRLLIDYLKQHFETLDDQVL